MSPMRIPLDAKPYEPTALIFVGNGYRNAERLLILVANPEDRIGPGQWCRAVCINDGLKNGSVLEYVKRGNELGFASIVLNTVDHVRGSANPEEHMQYVWDNVIDNCRASQIAIVANKKGGDAVMNLIKRSPGILQRFLCLALVDCEFSFYGYPPALRKQVVSISRNWLRSRDPLDAPILGKSSTDMIYCVSSGTDKNDRGIGYARASVMGYIQSSIKPIESSVRTHIVERNNAKWRVCTTSTTLEGLCESIRGVLCLPAALTPGHLEYWSEVLRDWIVPKVLSEIPLGSAMRIRDHPVEIPATPLVASAPLNSSAALRTAAATTTTPTPIAASTPPPSTTSTATTPSENPEDNLCCICMIGSKEAVIIPCGHVATCLPCAQQLVSSKHTCPICRSAIVSAVKLYKV
ncbi:UPF0528 protein [Pelomyxa schiedti]|nr:UPF0528 protein [Pelomyxa schiedti]